MINGVSVSRASGISFPFLQSVWDNTGIANGYYCDPESAIFTQTYLSSDSIYFQVKVDSLATTFVSIGTNTYNAYQVDTVNKLYNFLIDLAPFEDETIEINIHVQGITNPGIDILGTSQPIRVIAPHTGCPLALVEWRNDCPAMGINYAIDTSFYNRMRVPLLRLRPAAGDNERLEIEKSSAGKWKFCSSDLDEIYSFTTWELPDWMHQVLRKALQHSDFRVNGAQFVKQSPFRKIQQVNALWLGEAELIPVNQPYKVGLCCNNNTVFIVPPNAQLACDTTAQNPDHFAVDSRLSRDNTGLLITSTTANVRYIYNFHGIYFASIENGTDPTNIASWSYLAGSGSAAEFKTNIVDNIALPIGGFAGYFEIPETVLTALGLTSMNITLTLIQDSIGSQSAVCIATAQSGDPECPIPSLALSDFSATPVMRISNEGSTDSEVPVNNINQNSDYLFTHVWISAPCTAVELPLFTIKGLGGSASLTISGYHPSINPASYTAIEGAFSGGMGGTGYTFNKVDLVTILSQAGLAPPGGEWCIKSTVTHQPTKCSTTTEIAVPGGVEIVGASGMNHIYTPTGSAGARIGLNTYSNADGQTLATIAVITEIASYVVYMEGDIESGNAVGNLNTLDSNNFSLQMLLEYQTALDTNVFFGLLITDKSGLMSYSNSYTRYASNPVHGTFIQVGSSSYPDTELVAGGLIFKPEFYASITGDLSNETIQNVNFNLYHFPPSSPGLITISGTDDPEGATASPHTVNLNTGSATIVVTTNPSGLHQIHANPVDGEYYGVWEITTSSGLVIKHVMSARILNY